MNNQKIETEKALKAAGWMPGRKVDTDELRRRMGKMGFIVSEAAEHFLSEFVGLALDISGPGISRARESFILDPLLCEGEDDRFSDWSESIGEFLTPIGELHHRYFLGISESGEIYLVADWLASFGSGWQALENLILGVAPREVVSNEAIVRASPEYPS